MIVLRLSRLFIRLLTGIFPARRWLLLLAALLLFVLATLTLTNAPIPPPTVTAKAEIHLDRPAQALYQIEAQAAQTGWTSELARSAGNGWQALGDTPRALAYWEVAARFSPNDLPLAKQIAQSTLSLQRWSNATQALSRVAKLSPGDTWAHYHLALLQAAFNPTDALEHLRLAGQDAFYRPVTTDLAFIESGQPDDPIFAQKVGLTLAAHELWAYAERAFQYALTLDPAFPEAWAYAGLARDRQGKDGTAYIEEALRLAPRHVQVLYLQGLHLRLKGNTQGSLIALFQAANLDPANPAIAAELGSAYQLIGNIGEAEYWLKQAVSLSDNDPRFQNLLALFYQEFPLLGS